VTTTVTEPELEPESGASRRKDPDSDAPLLDVDDVYSSYGKSTVLRGVSLTVDRGEVVSLLGRNGAGKTTTLRTIAGVLKPDRGTITFDGEDITTLQDYQISRRGISYVAEERAIFPDLTVHENLKMGRVTAEAGIHTIPEVYDLLQRLEERRTLPASNLSGGEQQMLVIARALLSHTELLLLDEPTEGLAPQIIQRIREIIEHISDLGVPILLVEQNLEVAVETSDRCYILDKGEIVFEGDIEELGADEAIQQEHLGLGLSISEVE
jgi:branched-chain amino acid transport system ATP-binding protein